MATSLLGKNKVQVLISMVDGYEIGLGLGDPRICRNPFARKEEVLQALLLLDAYYYFAENDFYFKKIGYLDMQKDMLDYELNILNRSKDYTKSLCLCDTIGFRKNYL